MAKAVTGFVVTMVAALGYADALAADMIAEELPPPIWTGCYVGAHVGGATGKNDTLFPYSDNSTSPKGPLGGVQAGCDYQKDNLVFGGVVDVSLARITDDARYLAGVVAAAVPVTLETNVNPLATMRARLGYAVNDTLFYATGGLALARVSRELSTPFASQSISKTHTGWTIGGGIEHKFNPNWSVFGEYLFADFGKETYSYGPPLTPQAHVADLELNIFKIGVNYRF